MSEFGSRRSLSQEQPQQSRFLSICRMFSIGSESKLTELKPALFSGCNSLRSFVIPNNVEHIGSQTFHHCGKLSTISISKESKLRDIGEMAFDGCSLLEEVFVPKFVEVVRSKAFNGCTSLSDLRFDLRSQSLVIESTAFYECTSLPEVNFSSGLHN